MEHKISMDHRWISTPPRSPCKMPLRFSKCLYALNTEKLLEPLYPLAYAIGKSERNYNNPLDVISLYYSLRNELERGIRRSLGGGPSHPYGPLRYSESLGETQR